MKVARPSFSRRRFLTGGAAALASPLVASCFASAERVEVEGGVGAASGEEGGRIELSAGVSAHPLRGGEFPDVSLWTFNNASPGPTLRGRKGETLRALLQNNLPDAPTSVHWHGVRVDNAMDGAAGVTQEAVAPGESFEYDVNLPDAGTFWYHSHNKSWEQVARGLYGPLIVEDAAPDAPRVDADVILTLDDWKLARDGAGLDEESFGALGEWSHGGRMGNWLTVNSAARPEIKVPAGGRVRLRLINAANARIFRLALPEILEAKIVALDGMDVSPRDFPSGGFILAPAQRADVLADFPAEVGAAHPLRVLFGRGPDFTAATLQAVPPQKKLAEKTSLPSPPPVVSPKTENAKRAVVHMVGGAMGGMRRAMVDGKMFSIRELARMGKLWALNDRVGGADYELLRLRPGEVGILRVENDTAWPHGMHLHGHHFIPTPVKTGDGRGADSGPVLRDTHLLARGEVWDYVFTAGKPGRWLFHCHMLEHQAAGMAGVVVVA